MSTCTNDTDNLNKLYISNNSQETLILEYGPYMNWGRWNHNSSRIEYLINSLVTVGYSVQLNHISDENMNTQGNIQIRDTNNNIIVNFEHFQKNANNNNREQLVNQIIQEKFV